MKRVTILDKHMNEVVSYGGLPLRRGDVIRDLDKVAQSVSPHNWMRLRDYGLMGLNHHNEARPLPPNTKPLSLNEFYRITNIKR